MTSLEKKSRKGLRVVCFHIEQKRTKKTLRLTPLNLKKTRICLFEFLLAFRLFELSIKQFLILHSYPNMKTAPLNFVNYLNDFSQDQRCTIASIVTQVALESEDPKLFFQDLANHGCISGMVNGLVYYHDTYRFFDTHYQEIEEIREDYEIIVPLDQDLKNYLAWAVFELVADQIYQDWEHGS